MSQQPLTWAEAAEAVSSSTDVRMRMRLNLVVLSCDSVPFHVSSCLPTPSSQAMRDSSQTWHTAVEVFDLVVEKKIKEMK